MEDKTIDLSAELQAEDKEDLVDTLIAISVIAKRLAKKVTTETTETNQSIPYHSLFQRMIQLPLIRLRQQFRQPTRKVSLNLKVMVSLYHPLQLLRTHFVTEILRNQTMKHTQVVTS